MFTLFIGTERDAAGRTINPLVRRRAIQEIKREALDRFGGYSASFVFGGWRDAAGYVVEEKTLRLEFCVAYGSTPLCISSRPEEYRSHAECFAGVARQALLQASVLLCEPGAPDRFVR